MGQLYVSNIAFRFAPVIIFLGFAPQEIIRKAKKNVYTKIPYIIIYNSKKKTKVNFHPLGTSVYSEIYADTDNYALSYS